jgi:hypothetical protein
VATPPVTGGAFELMDAFTGLGWLFMGIGAVCAALAARARMRRAHGSERQQLKWIAFAAALAGFVVAADVVSFAASLEGRTVEQLRIVLLGLGFSIFPVAAGMAILRYRLYDIDVVVNRTLVYAVLTTLLAGAYVGSVLLLQLVLSPDSDFAIAGSTLAVAALFRPLRARVQDLVDRRFYRRRYDAARTLEGFGARLRDEVDLESLTGELRTVVAETMQPAHLSIWVRPEDAP